MLAKRNAHWPDPHQPSPALHQKKKKKKICCNPERRPCPRRAPRLMLCSNQLLRAQSQGTSQMAPIRTNPSRTNPQTCPEAWCSCGSSVTSPDTCGQAAAPASGVSVRGGATEKSLIAVIEPTRGISVCGKAQSSPACRNGGWRISELCLWRANDDVFLLGLKLAWMRAPAERRVSRIKRRSSLGEIQSRRVSHRILPALGAGCVQKEGRELRVLAAFLMRVQLTPLFWWQGTK